VRLHVVFEKWQSATICQF